MRLETIGGDTDRLLNERDVAARLGLSVATLRRWRLVRQGPKWLKLGSAVRYRPADIETHINGLAGVDSAGEAA